MGCDIHLHVEVKIKGVWEHYSAPYVHRNYSLFARMAGVRKDGRVPDDECHMAKGVPEGVSVLTAFDITNWGRDGHSHSWLSAEDAGKIQRWFHKTYVGNDHPPLFGYVFGNDVDTYARDPGDCKHLKSLGFEDVRVVFWFDN